MRARPRQPRRALPLAAAALAVALLPPPVVASEKVVVAVLPFVSSAPVFIAKERGLYAKEGLDVELRFFQAAQPVALAVAAGDADLGVTGLTAGFYNLALRGALRIVAGQARVEPGYDFVAYVASNRGKATSLASLDALEGRPFGITQMGSTFHYMLGQLADARGLELEQIRLVPLESIGNVVAALRGGSIDSAMLPAHLARPLAEEGAVRILGWAHENPWQLGALFTSTRSLDKRRSVVEAYLRAYRAACRIYVDELLAGREQPTPEALQLASELGAYVPSPSAVILAAAPFVPPDAALDVASVRRQVKWFQERRLVDRRLEVEDLLAAGLASGARRER
jgi:NitT/TauT family transport system substrate-binding protein